jgi:hypothetical protein
MYDERTECRKNQEILLDSFLSEGENACLSAGLIRHLENCSSCQRYWMVLGTVRSAFPPEPLYSPFLRTKTLRRLTDRKMKLRVEWLPLIVFAALLSFSFSFVLPGLLLSRLFMHWTSSTIAAHGAACGILLLLGSLATVATAISLFERGYIQLGNREDTKDYTKFPPAFGRHEFPSV